MFEMLAELLLRSRLLSAVCWLVASLHPACSTGFLVSAVRYSRVSRYVRIEVKFLITRVHLANSCCNGTEYRFVFFSLILKFPEKNNTKRGTFQNSQYKSSYN